MATTLDNSYTFDSQGLPTEMTEGKRKYVFSGSINSGAALSALVLKTLPSGYCFVPQTIILASDNVAGAVNQVILADGVTGNILRLPFSDTNGPPVVHPLQNLIFQNTIELPAAHGIPANHYLFFVMDGYLIRLPQTSLARDYGVPS